MIDDVLARHALWQEFRLEDGGLFQADRPRGHAQVPQGPGREVVDRGDLVAVAESIDEMGADEARASGDQDPLPLHRIEATGTSDIMFPLGLRLPAATRSPGPRASR